MLFSSYIFILIFLPIVLTGFYSISKIANNTSNLHKAWLFISSLFFYGYWNPIYLNLIIASIIINYFISKPLIAKDQYAKYYFYLGLFFNIGLLGYFKYRDFFFENINALFSSNYSLIHLALPLGISFFTLQQVAYIIDSYQGMTKKKNFLDYSLFVAFFPQLIAGPIVHYSEVMPQFEKAENKFFNHKNVSTGIFIFVLGLSKKVLLADTFSFWANSGFNSSSELHFFSGWATSLSYTFQLYFDFSGYSDMAIGLGYLFNIKIPQNFNSPFHSRNVIEFWTRWHMTLSQFITTYIFTPLIRSMPKFTHFYSMISIFTTMLIAGLWHGAAWSFVIYGALHGLALITNHTMKKYKFQLPRLLAIFFTFQFTNIVFTVFRAEKITDALNIFKAMFGFTYLKMPKGFIDKKTLIDWKIQVGQHMNNDENLNLLFLILGFIIVYKFKNTFELSKNFKLNYKGSFILALLFTLSLFGLNRVTDFIYFNF